MENLETLTQNTPPPPPKIGTFHGGLWNFGLEYLHPPKLELKMENLETLTQNNSPFPPRVELLMEDLTILVQNNPPPYPLELLMEDFVSWTDMGDYRCIPQGYRLVCCD